MPERSSLKDAKDRQFIMFGLRIVGDFGASIALPVILFVFAGQWVEKRYGGSPWFTILAFLLAALISGVHIYRKSREYAKQYQKLINESSGAGLKNADLKNEQKNTKTNV